MPDTQTDWPYDADQHDPLTALRIPVTSHYPDWKYTACFHIDSEVRPTDLEARQLVSFIDEYREHWFNERWKAKLAERPFDIDSGNPTWIFHKWADGDWSYRVSTWRYGPVWVPVFPNHRGTEYDDRPAWKAPMTLAQVMDQLRRSSSGDGVSARWLEWKLTHPDVFSEATSE